MKKLESNKVHELSEDELNRVAGEAISKILKKSDPTLFYIGIIQRIEIEPHIANAGYDLSYRAIFDGSNSSGCDTPQEAIIDLALIMGVELYTKED